MTLTLVILAAGKGSRFGGDKPMAAVGPEGQVLFEYSVFDAVDAGFNHIIFVVSEHQQTSAFSERLELYGNRIKLEFVRQSLESCVSPGFLRGGDAVREKPWGTAHAVLTCQGSIDNPFAVINADDYYGRGNFREIAGYLLEHGHDPAMCVLPGFQLQNTLSVAGGVNRGICEVDANGYLESVKEAKHIIPAKDSATLIDDTQTTISGESIVSMNFWGFNSTVFGIFENSFKQFLNQAENMLVDEFFIPDVVDTAVKRGLLRVKVIRTEEKWMGITYPADLSAVRGFLKEKSAAGFYPVANSR